MTNLTFRICALIIFFVVAVCGQNGKPAAAPAPQPEPSLADLARATKNKKDPSAKAKVVADSDSIRESKTANGFVPDLEPLSADWAGMSAASNAQAEDYVARMQKFIASHPKDEAKRTMLDWFSAQEQRIRALKDQAKLLDGGMDSRGSRDDVSASASKLSTELDDIRHLAARKGICWSWMMPGKAKEEVDRPLGEPVRSDC